MGSMIYLSGFAISHDCFSISVSLKFSFSREDVAAGVFLIHIIISSDVSPFRLCGSYTVTSYSGS